MKAVTVLSCLVFNEDLTQNFLFKVRNCFQTFIESQKIDPKSSFFNPNIFLKLKIAHSIP